MPASPFGKVDVLCFIILGLPSASAALQKILPSPTNVHSWAIICQLGFPGLRCNLTPHAFVIGLAFCKRRPPENLAQPKQFACVGVLFSTWACKPSLNKFVLPKLCARLGFFFQFGKFLRGSWGFLYLEMLLGSCILKFNAYNFRAAYNIHIRSTP